MKNLLKHYHPEKLCTGLSIRKKYALSTAQHCKVTKNLYDLDLLVTSRVQM